MNRPIDPAVTESVVSHYIGGQRHAGSGTRSADVFNPATGAVSAQVLLGARKPDELDRAVAQVASIVDAEGTRRDRLRELDSQIDALVAELDAAAHAA